MENVLSFDSIDKKFSELIKTPEWQTLEKEFSKRKNILLFGNGGNMAIADHGSIDICRLTDKNALSPGSGIICSAIIGEMGLEAWLAVWAEYRLRDLDPQNTLVIGFSCSTFGPSSNSVVNALKLSEEAGAFSCLISATKKKNIKDEILQVVLNVTHYHISEILSTVLFYQLIHSAGFECPIIEL